MKIDLTLIGGPTVLLNIGAFRVLVDPTFDPPGDYPIGARKLSKTQGPAVSPEDVGDVDVILLSHDQHPDNLDHLGRVHLERSGRVLTTHSARERLGEKVTELPIWTTTTITNSSEQTLLITGVPALHGPHGAEQFAGEVMGFVLEGEGFPTIYVSGDNASLDHVRAVGERWKAIDVAMIFAGAARTALMDGASLTLDSKATVETARILNDTLIIPVHTDGWAHFTEGIDMVAEAFREADLENRVRILTPGIRTEV